MNKDKVLLELKDSKLVHYEDNSYYTPGCPTCDYGSIYSTEVTLVFLLNSGTRKNFNLIVKKEYEKSTALDVATIIRILANLDKTKDGYKDVLRKFKTHVEEVGDELEIEEF